MNEDFFMIGQGFIDQLNEKFDNIFDRLERLEDKKTAHSKEEIDEIIRYLGGKFSTRREVEIVKEALTRYKNSI